MAITRSTPQAIISSTSTSGPFTINVTVPAGGLCAIFTTMTHCLDATLDQGASIAITDSGGHTWVQRAWAYNRNGGAVCASAAWVYDWYNGTGSPVSMTISVDSSAIRYDPVIRIAAQILTDVKDPSTYTPVTVTTYTHQEPKVGIFPTAVGSQIIGAISSRIDTGAGDTVAAYTAMPGSNIAANLRANDSAHAGAVVARLTTEVSYGDQVFIGAAAPFQQNAIHSLAIVEYLASGTNGGVGSLPIRGTAGTRIAIIGDSLMNQGGQGETNVKAAFNARGWPNANIWFRGVDGKRIAAPEGGSGLTTMDNIVQCRSDLGAEPDLWYIQLLGNDFGSTDQQIRDDVQLVLDALGPAARVAWVTMVQGTTVSANLLRGNAILHDMIGNRPNSYIVDWWEAAVANNNPDSWYTDGTHMTIAGYSAKNSYMALESLEAMYQITASADTNYRVRSGGAWVSIGAKTRTSGVWLADIHTGIVHDTVAPAAPVIISPSTSNTLTPTIDGNAEAFSAIALTINSENYQATTSSGGDWSITITTPLTDGQVYAISATATDAAGNVSAPASQNLTIALPSTTPADLSGLALWLKADTITGLINGANVTNWQDTTNSLTASPPGAAPTYATNSTPSGLPSVKFETSRTPLNVAGTATPVSSLTYVAVAKLDALLAETVLISAQTAGCFGGGMRNSSMASIAPGMSWFDDGPSGAVDTSWHVYIWTYDDPTNTITYSVDGVTSSVTTAYGPANSNIYFIGSAAAGFGGFGGLVAEVAAYGRVLTSLEIASLTDGLSNKYGL